MRGRGRASRPSGRGHSSAHVACTASAGQSPVQTCAAALSTNLLQLSCRVDACSGCARRESGLAGCPCHRALPLLSTDRLMPAECVPRECHCRVRHHTARRLHRQPCCRAWLLAPAASEQGRAALQGRLGAALVCCPCLCLACLRRASSTECIRAVKPVVPAAAHQNLDLARTASVAHSFMR